MVSRINREYQRWESIENRRAEKSASTMDKMLSMPSPETVVRPGRQSGKSAYALMAMEEAMRRVGDAAKIKITGDPFEGFVGEVKGVTFDELENREYWKKPKKETASERAERIRQERLSSGDFSIDREELFAEYEAKGIKLTGSIKRKVYAAEQKRMAILKEQWELDQERIALSELEQEAVQEALGYGDW